MAIIRAAKTFEGGDLNQRASTYLKTGTRIVDFKNKENGVYLFILGAYKADRNGAGVWYRPLKIRDNFGMGMYKKKFAVQPNCPIEYFANKVQTFAPEMSKSKETKDDGGKTRWIYPAWGRTAWRVLYNAAIFKDFGAGVHVLDLPQSGGASVIDEYVRGKDADGVENPELTNYEAAICLNIKLDLKANGQPWKIQINSNKTHVLPVELADTDYLYNLDEVISYPDKTALIAELKSIVPSDVFRKGLEGYEDGGVVHEVSSEKSEAPKAAPAADKDEDTVPMSFENPVQIPKSTVAPTVKIPKATTQDTSELPAAPSFTQSNNAALSAAQAFMRKKV